jgi:putative alpha-1,2-mannosidase
MTLFVCRVTLFIPGWDQYRSLIQLRAMLAPDQTSDIVQPLVDDAQQGSGGMTRWGQANRNSGGHGRRLTRRLPGQHVRVRRARLDTVAALRALGAGASISDTRSGGHPVREWLAPWLALGYVPDLPSITLEYATDYFGIAQLAGFLGDTEKRERYLARAAN